MGTLQVRWLGRVPYAEGLALQRSLVIARQSAGGQDTLLLLEHDPVITLGRSSDPAHVRLSRAALARRGIEVHDAGRGGDVTYHGPGQLVGYPILALADGRKDAHRYLRDLEQALIDTVREFDIEAVRVAGLTGIWVGREKLAAIGVRLNTGWITSHGFALNVGADLSGFSTVVPCGIADRGVTSMARLLGRDLALERVAERAASHLGRVFERKVAPADDARERLASAEARTLCSSTGPGGGGTKR